MEKTNEEVAKEVLDAQNEGEICAAEWVLDRKVHLEDLAELGIKEALPVIRRLDEISKLILS